jgi:hypothetical protein
MNDVAEGYPHVRPATRSGRLVDPDPILLRVLFSGLALGVIGFFLPWYSVSYTPPGGSVTVHHHTFTAFHYSYSGIVPERGGLADFSLGGFSFGEQVISGAAMTGVIRDAMIIVFVATLLSWPVLAPLVSPWVNVLRHRWAWFSVSTAHAVAVVIQAMGCLSFLLLAVGLLHFGMSPMLAQALGNSHAAIRAASYLHINVGTGFWLVLIGLLVIVGAIAKRFFATLAILVVGIVALAFVHSAWISPFLHHLGF